MKSKPSRSDILIIGGGVNGISAAVSAAREGAITHLVDPLDELGGRIGITGQFPLDFPASCNDPFFRESGIFEEIIGTLRKENIEGTYTGQARVLLSFLKKESNIKVMLGQQCLDVTLNPSNDRIDSCTSINRFDGSQYVHRAEYFIDCSEMGGFSKLAGAPGEVRTPSNPSQNNLQRDLHKSAVLIEVDASSENIPFKCPEWITTRWENNLTTSKISLMESLGINLCGFHHLEWIGEDPKTPDPIELGWSAWDFIKNRSELKDITRKLFIRRIIAVQNVDPAFRGVGDYLVSEKDLSGTNSFVDSVAVSRSPHIMADSPIFSLSNRISRSDHFEIPLRSLYSQKIKNLLWAGTHVSCDAQVSLCLSHPPTLSQMGTAVGHCAAKCISEKRLPRTLAKEGHIEKLRRELEEKNHRTGKCSLEDERDLTTRAKVTASTTWQEKNLLSLSKDPGIQTNACLIQFPVTSGHIETIRVFIICNENQRIDARLLQGATQNPHIPGPCLETAIIETQSGNQWIEFTFQTPVHQKGWHFLELRSNHSFQVQEGLNAPVGYIVQYPRTIFGLSGENPYSEYCVQPFQSPQPHRCAIMEITPSQKPYDAVELVSKNVRPYSLPGLWISQPTQFTYPEFLEFHWSDPVSISRLDLFFDPCFGYSSPPFPTVPQDVFATALVRGYRIYLTMEDRKSKLVEEVSNNESAHRIHHLTSSKIKSLEIEILSTHGLDRAQVFRVAAYE